MATASPTPECRQSPCGERSQTTRPCHLDLPGTHHHRKACQQLEKPRIEPIKENAGRGLQKNSPLHLLQYLQNPRVRGCPERRRSPVGGPGSLEVCPGGEKPPDPALPLSGSWWLCLITCSSCDVLLAQPGMDRSFQTFSLPQLIIPGTCHSGGKLTDTVAFNFVFEVCLFAFSIWDSASLFLGLQRRCSTSQDPFCSEVSALSCMGPGQEEAWEHICGDRQSPLQSQGH